MKAEINSVGVLTITPETGVESFALQMWWKDYTDTEKDAKDGNGGSHFSVLHISIPVEE